VKHFILHARLAIMNLDTDKNRKIPPLQYEKVYKLKADFPELSFSLNGGLKSKEEMLNIISCPEKKIKGCMIGRAALDNPWSLSNYDSMFYGKTDQNLTRKEIVYRYIDYCEEQWAKDYPPLLKDLFRPLVHLFYDERRNTWWKDMLFKDIKKITKEQVVSDHLKYAIEQYEKHNPEAVNKLPTNMKY